MMNPLKYVILKVLRNEFIISRKIEILLNKRNDKIKNHFFVSFMDDIL